MSNDSSYTKVVGTVYEYDSRLNDELKELRQSVNALRTLVGTLSGESLERIKEYFRLKNIYNSNAIEGNTLSLGETQLVIQEGLTITGKPLKDTVEAKNLAHALDFFEDLVKKDATPITLQDVRNIHSLILRGIDDRNAGIYRSVFVEISGSKYRPPDPARIMIMMDEFGKWLEKVSDPKSEFLAENFIDPIILSCVIHAWFVYIHPFIDGNGRTARILLNLILLKNGYPVTTIITKDDRQRYYDALEISQDGGDLTPFIRLVLESALESKEVYEQAAQAQLDLQEFVKSLVEPTDDKLRNEYEVFESAMRLLKGYFKQVVQMIDEQASNSRISNRVGFRDFGILEFEKYQSLRTNQSAKKTWFFRLTFYNDDEPEKVVRYLFFFGYPSYQLSNTLGENEISLHIATEVYPFYYDRLSNLPPANLPSILELGYLPSEERFVYLDRSGTVKNMRAEEIAREFIEQAFKNFGKK